MIELTEDEIGYVLENSSKHVTMPWLDRVIRETTESVNNGIELLDADYPGWASRVPLSRFDFADSNNCVLAWVFDSNFDKGYEELKRLSGMDFDAEEYGFDSGSLEGNMVASFIWKRAIAERVCSECGHPIFRKR